MPPRRRGSATSASDSQSPASDSPPSPHFSPASTASGGHNHHSDDTDSPKTTKRNSSRSHLDASRSYTAGKGGCWTCRLRRKKCDEQREGNSCKMCLRLNIECLGWGVKRPDWMRDKQRVQEYRAKITDKLRRENRIRGQPRQPYMQPSSQPGTPATAVQPTSRTRPKSYTATSNANIPRLDWSTPESGLPPHHQQANFTSLSAPTSAANSPHIPGIPTLGGYTDQNHNTIDMNPNFSYPSIPQHSQSPAPMSTETLPDIPYNLYTDYDLLQSHMSFQMPPLMQVPELLPVQQEQISGQTEQLVLYFFDHVKARQFKFYGNENDITNAIYSIIVREPQGAVANAICALASLHHTRQCQTAGYEPSDPNPENSFGKYLYNQALLQLMTAKHMYGSYSESDAIAALNLTSFGLFSDGWTEWEGTVQVAYEWLSNTGLLTDENPGLFIANMGSGGTYAVKTTIWLDVFGSITNMQPPRFMNLYHRLFGSDSGFSASLRMDQVTGFSDDVLYAIAQISTLAHWKSVETANKRLSTRELIRRGDAIEAALRRGEPDQVGLKLDIGLAGEQLQSSPTHTSRLDEETRRIVRSLFRESAILYLHTILNDPIPGVQEIINSVDAVISLMTQLPHSDLDHGLVFPICLAGCMTDNPDQRTYMASRIQDAGNIGNLAQTRSAMEGVWRRRDMLHTAGAPPNQFVDWRECLKDQGSNLLLI